MQLANLIFMVFFLMIGNVRGQDKGGNYYIQGIIDNIPNSVPVYLVRLSNSDTIDMGKTYNGEFVLEGKYEDYGEMHFLAIDTAGLGLPSNRQSWIRMYFEKDSIFVTGLVGDWPKVSVKGSPEAEMYEMLASELIKIRQEERNESIAPNLDSLSKDKIRRKANKKLLDLYFKYPDQLAVADLVKNNTSFNYQELESIYNRFSQRVKSSYPGRMLKRRIDLKQPGNQLALNNNVPEFTFMDSEGEIRSMYQEIKKSKYTLIDFWASWCKPCIEEVPALTLLYHKYDRKDFQIFGISMDKNKDSWYKALKEVQPEWIQGIDMNGDITKAIFGIGSIPAYLLVDNSGKMIAFYCSIGEYKSFGPYIKSDGLKGVLENLIQ